MQAALFVDFGSTNTKLTLVDLENEELIATSRDYTTVETDVTEGYNKAYEKLMKNIPKSVDIVNKLACSSAAGGLKMVAIGLVDELTAEAAKRAALGAGAKVLYTFCGELNRREAKKIAEANIDIILLAGGTDGGNYKCIIHNAKMLSEAGVKIPVVVAGNKSALDDIEEIFEEKVEYYISENVMPKLNQLNVESSRETIRKIFMKNIVHAKGMTRISESMKGIIMPTPRAVLKASEVLSKGTQKETGLGDLIVVDIGGATTDIHSLSDGYPAQSGVILRGLEEPYAKRTVEGDLGMRYSIPTVVEGASRSMLKSYVGDEYDIEKETAFRFNHPDYVAEDERALNFDVAMAKICTRLSMTRHAGKVSELYSCQGPFKQQIGKDLTRTKTVIGTGGVLVYTGRANEILKEGNFNVEEPESLKPGEPEFFADNDYILSAMGLLATIDENKAIRIMKKHLVKVGI